MYSMCRFKVISNMNKTLSYLIFYLLAKRQNCVIFLFISCIRPVRINVDVLNFKILACGNKKV